jgi:alkylation response protein AidB-like acyl-CoA dehydrogenase
VHVRSPSCRPSTACFDGQTGLPLFYICRPGCWFRSVRLVYYFPAFDTRAIKARHIASGGKEHGALDTLIPTAAELAGDAAVVARAEALRPVVEAASNAVEDNRRLTPALLERLHEAQLFRLLLPRSAGGFETDPVTFFHVIETISRGDASTAWCLSQAGGCAMTAAYLEPTVAREIFGPGNAVLAWGPGPARAVLCDGGYKVTGKWAFASGGRHATWIGCHAAVVNEDGTPLTNPGGRRVERTLLVPSSAVQWTDIWHVVGLRGTASDQFELKDHFVRADHSFSRDFTRPSFERRENGPLYRMSAMTCYEVGFAGVALGIARAALDSFVDTARTKIPRGGTSPIRDSTVVQTNLAQADVAIRAARAWLLQSVAAIWKEISDGADLSLEHRIVIRGASTHAIHKAREAVDFAYNAAGATAIFESHPLERRFRDIHTVTQQLQGRLSHFETVGAFMMGADTDLTWV